MSRASLNILIIGPSWVGDMVMAQSLFILLRQQFTVPRLDVLAPDWTRPLLERMPEVDNAIAMPVGHGQLQLGVRYQLAQKLRKQYDWAIVLPNSLKSALIPFFARIHKRSGFVGEMRWGLLNDVYRLDKNRLPKMVQRFAVLAGLQSIPPLESIPQPQLRPDAQAGITLGNKFALDIKQPILLLCPGAEFGIAKQWPARHYAELAKSWQQKGWQIILTGSASDNGICSQIAEDLPQQAWNLAGKTTLGEVIDLLSLASMVISNDSGLMHVAAAVNVPVIGVYGSTDPGFTPPLSPKARIVRLELPCSPCFKRECPLGHTDCLQKLPAKQVEAAMQSLLADSALPIDNTK